jgi:nanoRNase/pAp phosphatase (c-di-AMP/oligoRNAs hydrolase)
MIFTLYHLRFQFNETETFTHSQATAKDLLLARANLPQLAEKLEILESEMGEEYYQFVQLKTLKFMVKEINQIYNIDLGSVKKDFPKHNSRRRNAQGTFRKDKRAHRKKRKG